MKNRAVPISEGLVETESSLGTGIKLNISTFRNILKNTLGCSYAMNELSLDDFLINI